MRYWTADTHFGHKNIIEYCNRPWSNVDDMNMGIIERFNEVLTPNDMLLILGDVALGKTEDNLKLLDELNCAYVEIVPGNHDKIWLGHKKIASSAWDLYYNHALIIHPEITSAMLSEGDDIMNSFLVNVAHLPYEDDMLNKRAPDGSDKFAGLRPKNDGRWLIHGHVHNLWKVKGKQINVGVDVWDFKPVNDHQLMEIING